MSATRLVALSLDQSRVTPPTPRLATTLIARERIEKWLAQRSEYSVMLVAPVGFGKTTAIVRHMIAGCRPSAYVRLSPADTLDRFRTRIAKLLGTAAVARSNDELIEQLSRAGALCLCIDEIDRAPDATRAELSNLLHDAPAAIRLLLLARSRTAIAPERAIAKGLADICDPDALAFDEDEIAALASSYRVPHSAGERAEFHHKTEGWPIVASGAIRAASERRLPLGEAYEAWREGPGRHFPRYITEELSRASELDRSVMQLALRGSELSQGDVLRLADLETRGLLVRRDGDAYTPFRVLHDFRAPLVSFITQEANAAIPALSTQLFGRFEASIGEHSIRWIRRRDQQIFKFLLLAPGGAATRGELLEAFWPGTDAMLATQSIRTACSNIRKAIAAIVGHDHVARYFSSRGDVGLNLSNATSDVKQFLKLVRDGDSHFAEGNALEATTNYRAAEALFGGGLFAGEAPEEWYIPKAQHYQSLYVGILERLATLARASGHVEDAHDYLARIGALKPIERFGNERASANLRPLAYAPSRPLLNPHKNGTRRAQQI